MPPTLLTEKGARDWAIRLNGGTPPVTVGADRLREIALAALREIATRPPVERNPDGDDQAAYTMQMIAREALDLQRFGDTPPETPREQD